MPNPHPDYYALPFARSVFADRMAVIERAVPTGSSILDIGCNDGRISRRLLSAGIADRVIGVDVCDLLAPPLDGFEFVCADAASLSPEILQPVDVVLLLNLLHHIVADSREAAKRLMAQALSVSSRILCDMGSFSERGEWDWRRSYDAYWRSDAEMWDDLFEHVDRRTALLQYDALSGGRRTLWQLDTGVSNMMDTRYTVHARYRRLVSSVPDRKRLVPITSLADEPVPFGVNLGDLCPDVVFYELGDASGKRFWAKKWLRQRVALEAPSRAIESYLSCLDRHDFSLATDYSDTFGLIYNFDDVLFSSPSVVHYWDRHAYFTREECQQIEATGGLQIEASGLPRCSLRELTDFQIVRRGAELMYLDFEVAPRIRDASSQWPVADSTRTSLTGSIGQGRTSGSERVANVQKLGPRSLDEDASAWRSMSRPQSRRARLLVVGDAVAPTGYTRVTRSIIGRLLHRFDVQQVGINYAGDPHSEAWPIFPAHLGGDPHGVNRIADIISATKPDVILLINDLSIIGDYMERITALGDPPPVVAYFPIESQPLNPQYVRRLADVKRIVVYNEFALQAIRAAANAAQRKGPGFILPRVDVIPHGVDTSVFAPLVPLPAGAKESRRHARQTLRPGDRAFSDSFIVLNANRNQPRKRIDVTIAGFAMFAENKPSDVKLYLHMGISDQGWDLRELADRHGIADRLILSQDRPGHPKLGDSALNLVYNACDVGVNTAEAEGWGLTSFEHAATVAAQLVPGHTGPDAVWGGAATHLEPTMAVTTPGLLTDAYLIAPESVAIALESLYCDAALRCEMAIAAFRLVTEHRFSWDAVASEFGAVLDEVTRRSTPTA